MCDKIVTIRGVKNIIAQITAGLLFNLIDLITGIISAIKNKEVKSSKLRDGVFKKVGFLICYFLAFLIDYYGGIVGFNLGFNVLPVLITYTCTTEAVSIIENVHKINPDLLPEKLLKIFAIKKGGD